MQAAVLPVLGDAIGANLPCLRRYARALTGSQATGDRVAAATLEAILDDAAVLGADKDAKLGLFRTFHLVWSSAGAPLDAPDTRFSAVAPAHMANLTPNSREALLRQAIEGFTQSEVAPIMQTDQDHVVQLLDAALQEMLASISGCVMIIEDEAIISMDIAATRAEAVVLAARERPDLILADIQPADRSSGIDAVNDILSCAGALPVIFITAFPERLLTGERPEPAFLTTKPYAEEQVRSAVSQAMFFVSTETLNT